MGLNECCVECAECGSYNMRWVICKPCANLRNADLLAALQSMLDHDRGHGYDCDTCNAAIIAAEEK